MDTKKNKKIARRGGLVGPAETRPTVTIHSICTASEPASAINGSIVYWDPRKIRSENHSETPNCSK